MKIYNKLVRDRIPDIRRGSGRICEVKTLSNEELRSELNKKLAEEFEEYNQSVALEELADIVEVVYGIVRSRGVSVEEFEGVRIEKREKNGGFDEGLFLVGIEEKE
jgi:predicted house-cleaning noncanonical NTP pyrophosphatase (MazG superfamily)